jgi:hypothetical protein
LSALAIDDEYALLHYRIAGCQRALGRWDLARAQYRRASDLDRVPHGAPTWFNDWIRGIAERNGALVVDSDALLASASEHGLVGDDLINEFVHPNLRAHQLIAREIEEVLRGAGIPRPASDWRPLEWVDPRAADREIRRCACSLQAIRFHRRHLVAPHGLRAGAGREKRSASSRGRRHVALIPGLFSRSERRGRERRARASWAERRP